MKRVLLTLILLLALTTAARTANSAEAHIFSPATNPYARRIAQDSFQLVDDLKKIDPQVLEAFHARVPAGQIANKGEPFETTDDDPPLGGVPHLPWCRLLFAGGSPKLWFVLFEQGGIARYHILMVFVPERDSVWRLAATANGLATKPDLEGLRAALDKGRFIEETKP